MNWSSVTVRCGRPGIIILGEGIIGHAIPEADLVLLQGQGRRQRHRRRLGWILVQQKGLLRPVADLVDDAGPGQAEVVCGLDPHTDLGARRHLDALFRFDKADRRLAIELHLDTKTIRLQAHAVRGLGEDFVLHFLADLGQLTKQVLTFHAQLQRRQVLPGLGRTPYRREQELSSLHWAIQANTEADPGALDDLEIAFLDHGRWAARVGGRFDCRLDGFQHQRPENSDLIGLACQRTGEDPVFQVLLAVLHGRLPCVRRAGSVSDRRFQRQTGPFFAAISGAVLDFDGGHRSSLEEDPDGQVLACLEGVMAGFHLQLGVVNRDQQQTQGCGT